MGKHGCETGCADVWGREEMEGTTKMVCYEMCAVAWLPHN